VGGGDTELIRCLFYLKLFNKQLKRQTLANGLPLTVDAIRIMEELTENEPAKMQKTLDDFDECGQKSNKINC
jgi:hypothetical protein